MRDFIPTSEETRLALVAARAANVAACENWRVIRDGDWTPDKLARLAEAHAACRAARAAENAAWFAHYRPDLAPLSA